MTEKKRGPGRPKKDETPMSPAGLAANRANPRKHGKYAATLPGRLYTGCTKKRCPLGPEYPCDAKREAIESGIALDFCVMDAARADAIGETVRKAVAHRDPSMLADLYAAAIAGGWRVYEEETRMMVREGFAIEEPIVGSDGPVMVEGEVLTRMVANPRAKFWLDMTEKVGATAKQQGLTPTSAAEQRRDAGLADLVDWQRDFMAFEAGLGDKPEKAEP